MNGEQDMSKASFELFKKFWLEEIDKIENGVIDTRGAWLIYTSFESNQLILSMSIPTFEFTWDMWSEIDVLKSKLIVALEMARTKYKLQSKSLWVRILESIAGLIMRVPKPRSQSNQKF